MESSVRIHVEPTSYEHAISCAEKDEWIAAMDAEYESLVSNDAWELVNPSPLSVAPANRRKISTRSSKHCKND